MSLRKATYSALSPRLSESCVRLSVFQLRAWCARSRQNVCVGESEGLLTAVRFRAPLQPFRPAGPPEEPSPQLHPSRLGRAGGLRPRQDASRPQGAVHLSSHSLDPPINPIICAFFSGIAVGDLGSRRRLSSVGAWQQRGNLWGAAVSACHAGCFASLLWIFFLCV